MIAIWTKSSGRARAGPQGTRAAVPAVVDGRGGEFGFWHLLVRDVAYQQIPRAARAAKHLAAADWLEAKAGEHVEELAYHTGEALALAQATGDAAVVAEISPRTARYALHAGERMLASMQPRPSTCSTRRRRSHPRRMRPSRLSFCAGPRQPVRPVVCARPSMRSSRPSSASMLSDSWSTPRRRCGSFRPSAGASASRTRSRSRLSNERSACSNRPGPRVGRRSDRRRERPFPQGHVRGGCRDG